MDFKYLSNISQRINSCETCEQLIEIKAESDLAIARMQAEISKQLSLLNILIIKPSANFGGIISWIMNVIKLFKLPIDILIEYQNFLTSIVPDIQEAIEAKLQEIKNTTNIDCDL